MELVSYIRFFKNVCCYSIQRFIVFTFLILLVSCWDDIDQVSNGMNSEPGTKKYSIGEKGPSGIGKVFYITDGGKHGLEAAPEDLSDKESWMVGDAWNVANNNTSAEIGTGFDNSEAIITQIDHDWSAAKACREYRGGGKDDWFLPSISELMELYNQKDRVGGWDTGPSSSYWSSTEYDYRNARYMSYYSGDVNWCPKGSSCKVRPVRAF